MTAPAPPYGRRRYFERKFLGFDPAKKGGIIRRLKTRDEWCKFPDKPLHLAVGRLQEGVDASHPRNKTFRILKRPARFASVHLSDLIIPLIDEVKAEIELSALDQPFVIYILQSRSSIYGRPQRSLLGMKGWKGRPAPSTFWPKDPGYATQHHQCKITYKK